jgi:hypothetical protein
MSDETQECRCGKKQYSTRKSAKRAAKKAFPAEHLSAYPCGNGWHIGHLPGRVIAGDKDRNDIVRAPRADADPEYLSRVAAYLDQPCHADVLLELANGVRP